MGMIRSKIKWAVVEAVKVELQEQLDSILGGVTEEDLKEPEKKKKRKPPKVKLKLLPMTFGACQQLVCSALAETAAK